MKNVLTALFMVVVGCLVILGCSKKEITPESVTPEEIEGERLYYWDWQSRWLRLKEDSALIQIGYGTTARVRVDVREEISKVNDRIDRIEEYLNIEEVTEFCPATGKIYYRKKKEIK